MLVAMATCKGMTKLAISHCNLFVTYALLWNVAEVVSSATSCSVYSRATGKVGLMDEFRTGSSTCPSPDDPIRRRGQLASLVEVLEAFRDSRIELFE